MTADSYRARATEMRRLAETAQTVEARDQYLELAKGWDALALEVEAMKARTTTKRGRW